MLGANPKKQIVAIGAVLTVAITLLWWTAPLWQPTLNAWTVSTTQNFFQWQGYWSQTLQGWPTASVSISEIAVTQDKKIFEAEKKLLDLRAAAKSERLKTQTGYLVAGRGPDIYNVVIFDGEAPPVGAAVVTAEGNLVGRVFSVSGRTALVWPVVGANFKVSARLVGQPNFTGVVMVDNSGNLRLFQLPREISITDNSLVETSAFDNLIPEGLPIAKVANVISGTGTSPEAALLPLSASSWSQPIIFEWKKP